MKKFRDFAKDVPMDGDKIHIEKIFDKEIEILQYTISKSKYKEGNCLRIQFNMKEKRYITFTSSSVLEKQLKQYTAELPFTTTIRKVGNYFSLT